MQIVCTECYESDEGDTGKNASYTYSRCEAQQRYHEAAVHLGSAGKVQWDARLLVEVLLTAVHARLTTSR